MSDLSVPPPPLPSYPCSPGPPPHPGAAWQLLIDRTSGYPYYWNRNNNQVRWDCPSEYLQYQQLGTKPPPLPKEPYPSSKKEEVANKEPKPSVLVSAYGDSDDDTTELIKDETTTQPKSPAPVNLEAQPDFIGPVKPKPPEEIEVKELPTSEKDERCAETAENPDKDELQSSPAAEEEEGEDEDDADADEATLLLKLKEKSQQLASLGTGDLDSNVAEIIAPENLAKIEEDLGELADDILSQIEAEKPPDYADDTTPPPLEAVLERSESPEAVAPVATAQTAPDLGAGGPIPARSGAHGSSLLQLVGEYGEDSEDEEEQDQQHNPVSLPIKEELHNKGKLIPEENGENHEEVGMKRSLTFSGQDIDGTDDKINFSLPKKLKRENNVQISSHEKQKEIDPDLSEIATELVEKLEYFKVGDEKVSSLKILAIKLEALYSAYSVGALSSSYLSLMLAQAERRVKEAEKQLRVAPWKPVWDRLGSLHFSDISLFYVS